MQTTSNAIDVLFTDDPSQPRRVLVDAHAVEHLLQWLEHNPDAITWLVERRREIIVLGQHVESRGDWRHIKKQCKAFHVQTPKYPFTAHDEVLIAEIQHAYFGGDAASRTSAELVACGRRTTGVGVPFGVLSQHRGMRLVPHVQHFFMPNASDVGHEDDAIFLRALLTLNLHQQVRRAAFEQMMNHQYPQAIAAGVQRFVHEVREVGKLHNLPFAGVKNDQPMVDQALQCSEADPGKNKSAKTPHIQINDLAVPSEWREQKGYHNLSCGVVSALRNPLAHTSTDDPFIQTRFHDRRTALKWLCLLSLLFEKLDKRVAP